MRINGLQRAHLDALGRVCAVVAAVMLMEVIAAAQSSSSSFGSSNSLEETFKAISSYLYGTVRVPFSGAVGLGSAFTYFFSDRHRGKALWAMGGAGFLALFPSLLEVIWTVTGT